MSPPLRALVAAVLGILLFAAPAGSPAVASVNPCPEAIVEAFERLECAQRIRNFPSSHAKSAECREAEQACAAREIVELTESLTSPRTPTRTEALLDAAVRGADPDALERAQAALRVLGARGVSWDGVRDKLPRCVAPWESILKGCWREGRALSDRKR